MLECYTAWLNYWVACCSLWLPPAPPPLVYDERCGPWYEQVLREVAYAPDH